MAFLPGNQENIYSALSCWVQRLSVGQQGSGMQCHEVCLTVSPSLPLQRRCPKMNVLKLFQGWVQFPSSARSFSLAHFYYFKLSVQQGKMKKKNHFPPANDYIKHFSAVMLGEESGIIRKTCKEDHQFAVPTCSQWESDALDIVLPGPAWYTEQPRCLQS